MQMRSSQQYEPYGHSFVWAVLAHLHATVKLATLLVEHVVTRNKKEDLCSHTEPKHPAQHSLKFDYFRLGVEIGEIGDR